MTAEQKANVRLPWPVHFVATRWQCLGVSSIRDIRQAAGASQRSFAALLDAPFETYRPFDRDRRPAPPDLVERASGIPRINVGTRPSCSRWTRWRTNSAFIHGHCERRHVTAASASSSRRVPSLDGRFGSRVARPSTSSCVSTTGNDTAVTPSHSHARACRPCLRILPRG